MRTFTFSKEGLEEALNYKPYAPKTIIEEYPEYCALGSLVVSFVASTIVVNSLSIVISKLIDLEPSIIAFKYLSKF